MIVKLHEQTRITLAIRKAIQRANCTQAQVAARHNITIDTIRQWKSLDSDRRSLSHGPSAVNHADAG
ncbi:hypothetical protein HNQ59_000862 [Chitinivorax tropicus]|uniref:Uncharacterized protein n=1 Tax=Chitinivorax tropicus TaxID=714531 RepID=A0A840MN30_9PROT|nr:hypothetical protein [Chitinivorax tropicus]